MNPSATQIGGAAGAPDPVSPHDLAPSAVRLERLTKRFPGVLALDSVSIEVRAGEVVGLLGENGAGKSTLIKTLTGVYQPDDGDIYLASQPVRLRDPHEARRHGISLVPQDVLAVPHLAIGRNMLLGRERISASSTRLTRTEREQVQEALRLIGAEFSPDRLARDLSVPEVRLAQIARALMEPGHVLVLDEPTAVLSEHESERLLERLRAERTRGTAILYVTHRLSEVMAMADRLVILRDGKLVGDYRTADISRDEVVALMAKDTTMSVREAPARQQRSGQRAARHERPVLDVSDLSAGVVRKVSFTAQAGEIIGIAGVQGSGHGQLLKLIVGAFAPEVGSVAVNGRILRPGSVRDSFKAGLVFVPADRRGSGIVGPMSIRENLVLSGRIDRRARRCGLRWPRHERNLASTQRDRFSIRSRSIETSVGQLSGGNQQKVVLARALESEPAALLVEEPTQGIDVHAKNEIRQLLGRLVDQGCTLVVASSEFEELIGFADVIHVMCLGRIVATLDGYTATYRDVLTHALD